MAPGLGPRRLLAASLTLALCAFLPVAAGQDQPAPTPSPPDESPALESKLEERVNVRLAEIQVLITDRKPQG